MRVCVCVREGGERVMARLETPACTGPTSQQHTLTGNEGASPQSQSPDWRFQRKRHACEMSSRAFNCIATGNKAFQPENANCLPQSCVG